MPSVLNLKNLVQKVCRTTATYWKPTKPKAAKMTQNLRTTTINYASKYNKKVATVACEESEQGFVKKEAFKRQSDSKSRRFTVWMGMTSALTIVIVVTIGYAVFLNEKKPLIVVNGNNFMSNNSLSVNLHKTSNTIESRTLTVTSNIS